jgi:hypothetical protein
MSADPPSGTYLDFDLLNLTPNAVKQYSKTIYLDPHDPPANSRGVHCWMTPNQIVDGHKGKEKVCTKLSVIIKTSSEEDALLSIEATLEKLGRGFHLKRSMVDPNFIKIFDEIKTEMTEASTKGKYQGPKLVEETVSTTIRYYFNRHCYLSTHTFSFLFEQHQTNFTKHINTHYENNQYKVEDSVNHPIPMSQVQQLPLQRSHQHR